MAAIQNCWFSSYERDCEKTLDAAGRSNQIDLDQFDERQGRLNTARPFDSLSSS